jgi:exonuclease SbcC
LSDGRFDAVKLDEEYNLEVRDDGQMRPLNEFSGGEIDLIALAMRLALANVVSERHGSGGAGFLILDECFGSQDQDRRGSILTALRGLKGAYGQILLISHVGGIEDSADRVIEISLDEETGTASALVE